MLDVGLSEPEALTLWQDQEIVVGRLRERIKGGARRLILCAGTGFGKTACASWLLRSAGQKGRYAVFIADRVTLVDQASATLDRYGIRHGVVQGIHPRYDPREHVQVASAQTLARRSLPREPALIVVDEAHVQYRSTLDFMNAHPDAVVVGLTATPFTKGMAEHWHDVVAAPPTAELVSNGRLIEPIIYEGRAPERGDLRLNNRGDFTDESAGEAGIRIVGDVVAEWEAKTAKHFGGPVKTIVFAATVEHGRELCGAFAEAGYRFEQISYRDRDDDERRAKIAEFRADGGLDVPPGGIVGLISCGVLTRGFDVPGVRCGVSCRPYRKSLSSHMQEIGRVMRVAPGKGRPIWLDHSGNVGRLQAECFDVWDHGPGPLDKSSQRDSKPREERPETEKVAATCPACSAVLRGPECSACGWHRPARSGIHAVAGVMHEVSRDGLAAAGARPGLRAEVVADPRAVWDACLAHTLASARDEDRARKWAYALFKGIYPNGKLVRGWFDMKPPIMGIRPDALSLIEREVRRHRKHRHA